MRRVWPVAVAPFLLLVFLLFSSGGYGQRSVAASPQITANLSAALPQVLADSLSDSLVAEGRAGNSTPVPRRIPEFLRKILYPSARQYAQISAPTGGSGDEDGPMPRFEPDARFQSGVADLTDIISSADAVVAFGAVCQGMECPELDCEWAGMLLQDLHSTQVMLRAMLYYLGMANAAALEHLEANTEASITTAENLGNAELAQGVHSFLHNMGSLLLDIASVASALQDFLSKDPSQISETEFLEFLTNIDGAYEATKDFESAIGTMTNEMLDMGGSDFNLSTPIGDVTAGGPSITGDFNNDKSTFTDIYNIGQNLKELHEAGGDWRNALRTQRAGGGGPFAAVGQIAGRYLKAYSDTIRQERAARIGQLQDSLDAEGQTQHSAFEDLQAIQTRRFVAEDALAAIIAAKAALLACMAKAGCGARSLYNPVLPDFIEIGPNGEQVVGWAWALSRIKIELDVLRPRLKDLPPLRDNCAEDPEDNSYGWFGGDPSETDILIGQDSPTWCTYTTGGPENTPLIPEDDGDDPRDTPPPDGGGPPEDGDDPRDTPPPSSGGEDDGDDPRDTPRPEDGDDPRDTPGPCDELEQLNKQQIDIGTQLITRGSGLGESQIDRLTEQFNSNRERIAELEELCPGEDDGDDPRDTPPPEDGDDPRDAGGPCEQLDILEAELAELVRDTLTPGSSRSQAQTESMVQRARIMDAEISRLKRICPRDDDPRDAGGPPEDGDDPRDVPTVTIYVKAQSSVLQSDGTITRTAVPGQMVRIFDPATIDVPLPIPTNSLQNPLVASNTAASVPDRETFATAARSQGSILDQLEGGGISLDGFLDSGGGYSRDSDDGDSGDGDGGVISIAGTLQIPDNGADGGTISISPSDGISGDDDVSIAGTIEADGAGDRVGSGGTITIDTSTPGGDGGSILDQLESSISPSGGGSILDQLEPTGPGNPFEIGQGGTITIDPTLTTGATDLDVPIGAADEAFIQGASRLEELDRLSGINQPEYRPILGPDGQPIMGGREGVIYSSPVISTRGGDSTGGPGGLGGEGSSNPGIWDESAFDLDWNSDDTELTLDFPEISNPLGCVPGNACGDFTYGVTIPADDAPSGFVLADNPVVIDDAFQRLLSSPGVYRSNSTFPVDSWPADGGAGSEIFSDGFESGDLTSWSSTGSSGGNFVAPARGLRPQTSAGADPMIGTTDQLGEFSFVIPANALSNWTPGPCDKAEELRLKLQSFIENHEAYFDTTDLTTASDFGGALAQMRDTTFRVPTGSELQEAYGSVGASDERDRIKRTSEKDIQEFENLIYKLRQSEIDCTVQKANSAGQDDGLVSTPYQAGGQPDVTTPVFEVNLDAVENGSQNLVFAGGNAPALVNALPQGLQPFVSDTLVIGNNTFVTVTYANAQESQVNQLISQVRDLENVEINYCRDKQQAVPQSPPDDPYFSAEGSWGQSHEDQWAIRAVGLDDSRDSAWFSLGDNPQPVVIAVIDTGLDWNHLDIAWENLWLNRGEVPDNGIDDDFNGYVDDLIGWNFYENTNNPWDHDGHGTIVTGIIAANTNNGLGIAGINPYARIMVLKGLNAFGHSRASYLAKAIVYAADNGAQVISMSVGGKEMTMIEQQALDYAYSKGAVIVIAAGNEGVNVDSYGLAANDNVITVGATGLDGKHAVFSNWGSKIDIAAPGVEVLSLRARSTDTMLGIEGVEYVERANYVGEDRRYYRASGTSFAAPIVAGVASLLLTRDPTLTNDQVKQILLQSARDADTPGVDQFSGYGIVDAQAALRTPAGYFVEASISGVAVDQANALIQVNGNALADEFDEAWIEIGPGPEPTSWKRIGSNLSNPVQDGIVGSIPFSELGGSPQWTIKLVVRHEDGRSREAWFLLSLG